MLGKIQQHQGTEEMIVLFIIHQYYKLHPTDPRADLHQDVTSSYIHKNYKCSRTTRNTVCPPPPPTLSILLIYNTLTK